MATSSRKVDFGQGKRILRLCPPPLSSALEKTPGKDRQKLMEVESQRQANTNKVRIKGGVFDWALNAPAQLVFQRLMAGIRHE